MNAIPHARPFPAHYQAHAQHVSPEDVEFFVIPMVRARLVAALATTRI